MRSTLSLVVLALVLVGGVADAAAAGAASARTHVRPLTPGTARLLADAAAQSSIVSGLLESLERTDVVVYLSDSGTWTAREEPHASLTFLSSAAGLRYLVVWVDRWASAPWSRIAWLGHELQHALEVSQAPEVHDATALAALYRRIGWEGLEGRFESDDARTIGNRVLNQLGGFGR